LCFKYILATFSIDARSPDPSESESPLSERGALRDLRDLRAFAVPLFDSGPIAVAPVRYGTT
jgi:hypothetical protein